VVIGFQSYPTLLAGEGIVPRALMTPGGGVNLDHRDARLALGETRDGRLLIVLTRFDAMGEITGSLPLGPTTPEMAAIMGALGARDAVMLDGHSAQLPCATPSANLRSAGPMRKVPRAIARAGPGGEAACCASQAPGAAPPARSRSLGRRERERSSDFYPNTSRSSRACRSTSVSA
jgi:hypothetical protein